MTGHRHAPFPRGTGRAYVTYSCTGRPMMADAMALRKTLVDELVAEGKVRDPALIAAFADVPRHLFVPSFFMPTPADWWLAIDSRHPAYYPIVYADTPLTTQLKGGIEPNPDLGRIDGSATSGSNPPGLMAAMLEALGLSGTETVLEIGTGT